MIIKRARDAQHGGNFNPVAVIDNDPAKIGLKLCGVKVVGNIDAVEHICKIHRADEIIVAIPSATKDELYEIFRKCLKTNLPMKFLQNFVDMKSYLQEDKTALKSVKSVRLCVSTPHSPRSRRRFFRSSRSLRLRPSRF